MWVNLQALRAVSIEHKSLISGKMSWSHFFQNILWFFPLLSISGHNIFVCFRINPIPLFFKSSPIIFIFLFFLTLSDRLPQLHIPTLLLNFEISALITFFFNFWEFCCWCCSLLMCLFAAACSCLRDEMPSFVCFLNYIVYFLKISSYCIVCFLLFEGVYFFLLQFLRKSS